jgi:hypothetical protein
MHQTLRGDVLGQDYNRGGKKDKIIVDQNFEGITKLPEFPIARTSQGTLLKKIT